MNNWTLIQDVGRHGPFSYWQRSDGAYVYKSRDEYYSNPLNPRCRMWTAFCSDRNADCLSRTVRRSRLRWPRKWQTAEAAMRALDREHPMKES